MSKLKLLRQIQKDTSIWQSDIHGLEHWLCVEENGHLISEMTGADKAIVSYFAYLHDCQRWDEYDDPEHGPRAAVYAQKHRSMIELDDDQFELLRTACYHHTHAMPNRYAGASMTLAACWDGDRLDIGRVGVEVDPSYLFSSFAKSLAA